MIPLAVTSLRRKAAVGALIVLLAWASTLGLDLAGILKPYSLKTLDLLFRITSLSPASPEVVVVTVDQPDLDFFQKQGVSWPWPRQLYAPIIEFCRRGGARAVIFDVLYTENSVYGAEDDQQLAQTVAASGDVILPVVLSRGTKETGPPSDEVLAKASLPFQGPPPPGLTTYQGLTSAVKSRRRAGDRQLLPGFGRHLPEDPSHQHLPGTGLAHPDFCGLLSFPEEGTVALRGRGTGPGELSGAGG